MYAKIIVWWTNTEYTYVLKTLKERIYKFTWDQVINDFWLNFASRTHVYHHWIEIKFKVDTFFTKTMEEY